MAEAEGKKDGDVTQETAAAEAAASPASGRQRAERLEALVELARRTLAMERTISPLPWRSLGLAVLDSGRFVVARMAGMRGERRFSSDHHPNASWIAFSRNAAPRLARAVIALAARLRELDPSLEFKGAAVNDEPPAANDEPQAANDDGAESGRSE